MTLRRPPGSNFETAVEKEIRESIERGEFDELRGLGRPIPLDDADDELWWVKRKLKDEGFVPLPPSLQLRRDAHQARERARQARTEAELVDILEAINERLRAAVRIPLSGPSVYVPPYDLDKARAEWRAAHPDPVDAEASAVPDPVDAEASAVAALPEPPRRRWRRRR